MAYYCRNVEKEEPTQVFSNRFEVLKVRVMQRGEGSSKETMKDRREILREEKAKRRVEVRQTKVERKEKKEKTLREVVVKIGLKQEEEEEGVVRETLLDSGVKFTNGELSFIYFTFHFYFPFFLFYFIFYF